MKKILLISTILLLTGCLGDVGKGYITKTCTKTENVNGKNVETTITVRSKSGDVETIKIKEKYDDSIDILDSKKSEQIYYKHENGITLDINDNEYTYTINAKEISEEIKERFNIKNEQHKQIQQYQDMGYTCK